MKSPAGGRCAVCDRPFRAAETIMREVRGWERLRAQGGANAITRREETGRLAHRGCIEVGPPPAVIPGQLELVP